MIQRLASKIPDRLPMRGAACEHQRRLGRRVLAKNRKHLALVVVAEVKETVPRKNAGKRALQGKPAHVRDDPFLLRKMLSTDIDHRRGRIHANDGMTQSDQVRGHWRSSRDRGSGQPEAATPRSGRARAFRAAWCVRDSRSSPTPCAGTDQ